MSYRIGHLRMYLVQVLRYDQVCFNSDYPTNVRKSMDISSNWYAVYFSYDILQVGKCVELWPSLQYDLFRYTV